MQPIVTVIGPRQAGPGERELMLDAAREAFERRRVGEVTRIDVPGKGSADDADDSGLRSSVAAAVPALQSGSLFGGSTGVLIVDADQLLKREADVLAEVIGSLPDDGSVVAVFASFGALPASLAKAVGPAAEKVEIKAITEKTAAAWMAAAARRRSLRLERGAAEALIQRFGSDVGALARALDQLAVDGDGVTEADVRERFKNRPDEPMWHFTDAVVSGDTGEALRRLEDFLLHGHPLQLLAFLQSDMRRRALAATAPDYETFLERDGGRRNWGTEKVWKQRRRARPDDLRRAIGALARADLHLKTRPEATHRVTMERLTVALCHWYGGRGS